MLGFPLYSSFHISMARPNVVGSMLVCDFESDLTLKGTTGENTCVCGPPVQVFSLLSVWTSSQDCGLINTF